MTFIFNEEINKILLIKTTVTFSGKMREIDVSDVLVTAFI